MENDNSEIVIDSNWVSKSYYLSEERLAKLDEDLANMTVTDEEMEASMTDEAINALPDVHGCILTWLDSLTGEKDE